MKKLLALFLTAMMVFTLAGCSSNEPTTNTSSEKTTEEGKEEKAEETKVLGVVMPNATHGFLGESIKHAEAATKEFAKEYGFEYKFLTSAESSEQNNQLDTLINEKVDCIVLWPHNGDELRSGAQKVMDAGISLVIYDRLINGFKPTLEVMGDNVTIGQETGKYLNNYFADDLGKGEVNILEFKGDNSTVPQQRSDGFSETADKNIKIVQQFSTDWQRAKAQEQMETFLNTSSVEDIEKIKAVFTHDDEVVLGVLDAIINYNGSAKLDIRLLTGVGGRRENLDTFKSYKDDYNLDQVTYLFSPTMVRDAVEYGAKILNGEELSGLKLIDTLEIDLSNEEEFRNSEIYKIRYESGI
ncbi:ABC transporter substrate-binding protein [Clostridium sediminicola]|uniref:substrate-binding domain-containing protein n=1 Tax=Clostridium sediminicola TaxID=3114879 RepID=UPI0031F22AFD